MSVLQIAGIVIWKEKNTDGDDYLTLAYLVMIRPRPIWGCQWQSWGKGKVKSVEQQPLFSNLYAFIIHPWVIVSSLCYVILVMKQRGALCQ